MSKTPPDETVMRPASDRGAPRPENLVRPTWRPAALAFGITLFAWGLISSVAILAMGLVVVIGSLTGWIKEIRYDRKES